MCVYVRLTVINHPGQTLPSQFICVYFEEQFLSPSWPHTVDGCQAGPPCGHSSLASWSFLAPLQGRSVPCYSHACIHAGCSGNGDATWSYPEDRVKKSKVYETSQCPGISWLHKINTRWHKSCMYNIFESVHAMLCQYTSDF